MVNLSESYSSKLAAGSSFENAIARIHIMFFFLTYYNVVTIL